MKKIYHNAWACSNPKVLKNERNEIYRILSDCGKCDGCLNMKVWKNLKD